MTLRPATAADQPFLDAVLALEDGRPVGAAWVRLAPGGYGFVAPDVPELTIGVLPAARRRGVATALLTRLVEEVGTLSLSVEADNPARILYERLGFAVVSEDEGALTMRRSPRPAGDRGRGGA
jgi:ribosomal protein S18 acetylase RimI-like enzyme